jgi:putative ATP-binding cassette transporter
MSDIPRDDDATVALGRRLLAAIPGMNGESAKAQKPPAAPFGMIKGLITRDTLPRIILICIAAAMSATGILFVLNAESKAVEGQHYDPRLAVLFVILILGYRLTQNLLIASAGRSIERALDVKRQSVSNDVLQLSLLNVESVTTQEIRDGMSSHYASFSQTIVPLIFGFEALFLLGFMFVYVLTLSFFAGVLTVAVVLITLLGYARGAQAARKRLAETAAHEAQYRRITELVLVGVKELRFNQTKRTQVQDALNTFSGHISTGRSSSAKMMGQLIATGTTVSYLMAGTVVFILPLFSDQQNNELSRIVVAVIFLLGPIGSLVQTSQQFTMARFALNEINKFEASVRNLVATQDAPVLDEAWDRDTFETLLIRDLTFQHHGDSGFGVTAGALDINRGEVVFMTGGNGSGKTTLLRVLSGLYPRQTGEITINGTPIPQHTPQQYRDLFASVFTDFCIFDQAYGLDEAGIARLEHWLTVIGVRDKLGTPLNLAQAASLSTGQRKRVALALALAEDRPVLILDEWAADQDPQTRRMFYTELLPQLKQAGTTVFAITHDEQYFAYCDRRVHMNEGQLTEGAENE